MIHEDNIIPSQISNIRNYFVTNKANGLNNIEYLRYENKYKL